MKALFRGGKRLSGTLEVPSDKSISHRAAVLASIASGDSVIRKYSPASDCLRTLDCLGALGVEFRVRAGELEIAGGGQGGFSRPEQPLDAGNSGTTMRLLAGVLASRPMEVTITGDESLRSRPMGRIAEPLELMGARVRTADITGHPPLVIEGGALKGIEYAPAVASAQVKSCILLAGLAASGSTTVHEKARTRDHTERLMSRAGLGICRYDLDVSVTPGTPRAFEMEVPGDFSSAAFPIAAALLLPGSEVTVTGVGLNRTRTGFLDIARSMGAELEVRGEEEEVEMGTVPPDEPAGSVRASYSELKSVAIGPDEVALSIDEVTLVALLATRAEGRTVIRGAGELRHKESDRISYAVAGLRAMGALIREEPEGIVIEGPCRLEGARVSSGGDHRIAMMLAVAGLVAEGETAVEGWESTEVSYPGFEQDIRALGGDVW